MVGIDLASNNCIMSVFGPSGPAVVPNAEGDTATPIAVAFAESGEMVIGKAALRQAIRNPDRVIVSFVRHLGTDWTVEVASAAYDAQDLTRSFLEQLRKSAEASLAEPIGTVVAAVPARFDEATEVRVATRLSERRT